MNTVPRCLASALVALAAGCSGAEELPPPAGATTIELGTLLPSSTFREVQIQEPSMCAGSAKVSITYDKAANTVVLTADFKGLPYRKKFCYDYDPSTKWNDYPACVEDGQWQIWLTGRVFTKKVTFYYDGATGDLLGQANEVPSPPPGAKAVQIPAGQMVCTAPFESDPQTLEASVRFTFTYDKILDALGSGGTYYAVVPRNLNQPDRTDIYYTQGGLPGSEAMNFDDVLADLKSGGHVAMATSYEPAHKPDSLRARDNLMIGWGAVYPADVMFPPTPAPCGTTFQWPDPFAAPTGDAGTDSDAGKP